MLHFVFGASPQRFLCHFPNKIASFPQQFASFPQQLESLPQQHIFSFPQQLCVTLPPAKKSWFFKKKSWFSYLNIPASLWKKLYRFWGFRHACLVCLSFFIQLGTAVHEWCTNLGQQKPKISIFGPRFWGNRCPNISCRFLKLSSCHQVLLWKCFF